MVIMNYNPLVFWSFPGTGTIEEPGLESGEEVEICGKETWAKKFVYLGKIFAQFSGPHQTYCACAGSWGCLLRLTREPSWLNLYDYGFQHPLKK